jgi:arylsulfatase
MMAEETFRGRIGMTVDESEPYWPDEVEAPPESPNIVWFVLDDVGFGQLGCYGGLGGRIRTPHIDRLASGGLQYTRFHATALCAPSRASLLTGHNPHVVGMGNVTELATGFPGYNGHMPRSCGMISEILQQVGYATFALGKWHLTREQDMGNTGRRDSWPLGRGFDRFYGFLGAETQPFAPELVDDNHLIDPPAGADDGYHLTEDLADCAIGLVREAVAEAPERPFFLYFATAACHAPHQAPASWIDEYRGAFDAGWDVCREECLREQLRRGLVPADTKLPGRPPWIVPWDSLTSKERAVFSRMMEAYAGYLSHTDAQIGRVVDALEEMGIADNTIICVVSDNGASAEGGPVGSVSGMRYINEIPEEINDLHEQFDKIGGPHSYGHYPYGWAFAGNTPHRRWKREVHEGGVTEPLVVRWPRGIAARGELRRQYMFVSDLMPTMLDAAGVQAPAEIRGIAQRPLDGISFADTFDNAELPTLREVQYYETFGSRAIWYKGWKAVTYHAVKGLEYDDSMDVDAPFDDDVWELYDIENDIAEANDLATTQPDRLSKMIQRWWVEAGKYQVLPLDNRSHERIASRKGRPRSIRTEYRYHRGVGPIPESKAVNIRRCPHTITADIEIPSDGAQGVLLAHGGRFGGYALVVLERKLTYIYNYLGISETVIQGGALLPGPVQVGCDVVYTPTGAYEVSLTVGGTVEATGTVPHTMPNRLTLSAADGLRCGYDGGTPISELYTLPFTFTGTLKQLSVALHGEPAFNPEADARWAIATQ